MLSGIGPSTTLSSFDISVVSALEGVGQNLWVRHHSNRRFSKAKKRVGSTGLWSDL